MAQTTEQSRQNELNALHTENLRLKVLVGELSAALNAQTTLTRRLLLDEWQRSDNAN